MVRFLFSLLLGGACSGQPFTINDPAFGPAPSSQLASAFDNFDRADSNPMSTTMSDGVSTWTNGPGAMNVMQITSSNAVATTATSASSILTPTFAANQKASVTVVDLLAVGICLRMQPDSGAGYLAYAGSGSSITVYKVTDTGTLTFTAIGGNLPVSLIAGETLEFRATGTSTTTLEVFTNSVSLGVRTDASDAYTSGQPGIYGGSSGKRMDNLSASDL